MLYLWSAKCVHFIFPNYGSNKMLQNIRESNLNSGASWKTIWPFLFLVGRGAVASQSGATALSVFSSGADLDIGGFLNMFLVDLFLFLIVELKIKNFKMPIRFNEGLYKVAVYFSVEDFLLSPCHFFNNSFADFLTASSLVSFRT